MTPFILAFASIFIIREIKNFYGYLILIFSGLIGVIVFHFPLEIKSPLLVMISGLFGLSSLYVAFSFRNRVVKQKTGYEKVSKLKIFKATILANLLGIFVSLFPGIGSGFATFFGHRISNMDLEEYIILNGAITTVVIFLSFFVAQSIGRSRTAAGLFFKNVSENTLIFNNYFIFIFIILGMGLGFLITIYLGKKIAKLINKIDYKLIIYISTILLFVLTLFMSNLIGYLIFITCSFIGLICILTKNPRTTMLFSIILPVFLNLVI